MKLSWKLFFITTPIFILLLTLFGTWMIQENFQNSMDREKEQCMVENQMFQNSYELTQNTLTSAQREEIPLQKLVEKFYRRQNAQDGNARILSGDGTVLYRDNGLELTHHIMEQLDDTHNVGCEIVSDGKNRYVVVMCLSTSGEYIETAKNVTGVFEDRMRMYSRYQTGAFLMAVFAGGIILLILFAVMRNMQKLSRATQQFARGQYDTGVQIRSRDEIGRLAEDFNHMASEVKRSAQLEKDILANVSHDLRTPLTLIKGYAETVRDLTGTDDAKRTEQCNIIVDETDRLSALVNSVMELSKVQNGSEKPNPIDFDMSELCFEVAGRYDALCDQNHWTLRLEADHAAPVNADPAMMERVLHNLLGNAFHHIGEDGVVILRVIPQDQGCRVEVVDHGPGIPPEDLPHLFDRYYRARQDAGKTGTGLGLSITKAILQQHGFAFGVDSAVGQGSTFWFTMCDTRTQPNP